MRDGGMMLPAKGALPFSGSLIVALTPEKLPVKKAAGIDVVSAVADCTSRKPSYDDIKKVLFRPLYSFGITTGPSSSYPNWFCRRGGFAAIGFAGVGKVKNVRASRTWLRMNSTSAP